MAWNKTLWVIVSFFALTACGVKAPPLPPIADNPQKIDDQEEAKKKKKQSSKGSSSDGT